MDAAQNADSGLLADAGALLGAALAHPPTRCYLLWHGWRLPTRDTDDLRRSTAQLVEKYLTFHYPGMAILLTFDEHEDRNVEAHLDFDYDWMLPSDRERARLAHIRHIGALVGDVLRYFVANDSYERMQAARRRRRGNHEAYGMGAGRDSIPWPPHGYEHMPRFPLQWDKTSDGSTLFTGPLGPLEAGYGEDR